MKSFIIIVGFLLATLLQVQGRSIGRNDEIPKVLVDTKQQAYACGMKMGPIKLAQIPPIPESGQLPEDNSALNEYWGCIWKKKGIIDDDTVLSEVKLEEYLFDMVSIFRQSGSEELTAAHDMLQQCRYVHGIGYGQTAVKIENCINEYIEARY